MYSWIVGGDLNPKTGCLYIEFTASSVPRKCRLETVFMAIVSMAQARARQTWTSTRKATMNFDTVRPFPVQNSVSTADFPRQD